MRQDKEACCTAGYDTRGPKVLPFLPQINFTARSERALQGDNNREGRETEGGGGRQETERAKWKTTASSSKDRDKRAFSLLPALRTRLINHLYAINHQESTARLTRWIQMPLKLLERTDRQTELGQVWRERTKTTVQHANIAKSFITQSLQNYDVNNFG